jgi:hypothetical protein
MPVKAPRSNDGGGELMRWAKAHSPASLLISVGSPVCRTVSPYPPYPPYPPYRCYPRLTALLSTELDPPRMGGEVDLVRWLFLVIHAALGAFLLGGALYSIMTVQPRAKAFFKDVRNFERFLANLAHGARWQFVGVLVVIVITGLIEPWFAPHPFPWWICFGLKCALWIAILICFVYVSWYLWPRRIFATVQELPAIQREFTLFGRTILALLLISFVLGIAMGRLR